MCDRPSDPVEFAMTMLSYSVIEYNGKYKVAGEINHAKDNQQIGSRLLYEYIQLFNRYYKFDTCSGTPQN